MNVNNMLRKHEGACCKKSNWEKGVRLSVHTHFNLYSPHPQCPQAKFRPGISRPIVTEFNESCAHFHLREGWTYLARTMNWFKLAFCVLGFFYIPNPCKLQCGATYISFPAQLNVKLILPSDPLALTRLYMTPSFWKLDEAGKDFIQIASVTQYSLADGYIHLCYIQQVLLPYICELS